eukprot:scaffold27964_cov64-Phaeocystis_antarctica.AAC.5
MMGPPYCTYGPRVPASCVPCVYQPRRTCTSLGRAVRTAYRGATGQDQDGPVGHAQGLEAARASYSAAAALLRIRLPRGTHRPATRALPDAGAARGL